MATTHSSRASTTCKEAWGWIPAACRLPAPAALLLALLLAGCAAMAQPQQEFRTAFQDYAERLRWGDFQQVAGYLPAAAREDFLQRFAVLDDLHIVDVQLEAVDFSDEGRRARTTTALEYYLMPSITVKKVRLRQQWHYRQQRNHSGGWRLDDPFPPFP